MKLRRSACIDTLYLELPFLDRFQAAKEDGFDAVEFWSWADRDLSAVKSASDRAGIPVCGFNGDADLSLIDPAQREAYLAFLHRSLEAPGSWAPPASPSTPTVWGWGAWCWRPGRTSPTR